MKTDYLLNKEFKPEIASYKNALDAVVDAKELAQKVNITLESVKESGITPATEPTISGAYEIDEKYQKAKTIVTELIQVYGKECTMANTLAEQITDLQEKLEETVKAERKRKIITFLVIAAVIIILYLFMF
jgi:ribosomal protein S17E